jgi:dipeptidyl aminopeptidase/acylaminoacyl peptidase
VKTLRVPVLGVMCLAAAVGCGLIGGGGDNDPVRKSDTDYVTARNNFKTKLKRSGSPPWPSDPLPGSIPGGSAMPGAVKVGYPSEGRVLTAYVNAAARQNGPKRPAVLYLHGGFAFGAGDWKDARPFLAEDYHVMMPVLRGENGQPGAFSLFYDEVDDCLAAAAVLTSLPGVDPDRLYVAGHSAGGTLSLLCALSTSRFKACASFAGSPDQKEFFSGETKFQPFDPYDNEEYRMRSPLAFAEHFKCPVRAYYGDRDAGFAQPTRAMADRAKAAGKDVDAVEVRGDHQTMVVTAAELAVQFFKQHGAN